MKECTLILFESHILCNVKAMWCYVVRMQGGIACSRSAIGYWCHCNC